MVIQRIQDFQVWGVWRPFVLADSHQLAMMHCYMQPLLSGRDAVLLKKLNLLKEMPCSVPPFSAVECQHSVYHSLWCVLL